MFLERYWLRSQTYDFLKNIINRSLFSCLLINLRYNKINFYNRELGGVRIGEVRKSKQLIF